MDIDFLHTDVRGSIITDIVKVAAYHSRIRGTNAGWYSVHREVFCMIDFLGSITYNNNPTRNETSASTRKSTRFIESSFLLTTVLTPIFL